MAKKWTPGKTKKLVKKAVVAAATGDFSELDKAGEEFLAKNKEKAENTRSSPAEKEAKLLVLQRMMFRKMDRAMMCKQLNIGDRQLRRMQKELKDRTLSEVKGMNFPQFVGQTINFYDEVRAMALMISSNPKVEDMRIKLQAMNQALGAEDSKHKFLSLCGVYKSQTADAFAKSIIADTSHNTRSGADVEGVLSGLAHALMKSGVIMNKSGHLEPGAMKEIDFSEAELIEDEA
jgi:hypothetical protein